MTTSKETNVRELLFARATQAPTVTGNDPVAVFLAKIDTQIGFANDAKAGKEVSKRSVWFKKVPTGYNVRIGRAGFDMGQGNTLFAAKTLDEVIEILDFAKQLIPTDEAIGKQIVKLSKERSERLRKTRGAKK
jgi:hypothetical protein